MEEGGQRGACSTLRTYQVEKARELVDGRVEKLDEGRFPRDVRRQLRVEQASGIVVLHHQAVVQLNQGCAESERTSNTVEKISVTSAYSSLSVRFGVDLKCVRAKPSTERVKRRRYVFRRLRLLA